MTYNISKKLLCVLFIITTTYLMSHFSMLFVQGMWWDDCCVWLFPDEKFNYVYGPEQSNHVIIRFLGNIIGHNADNWPIRSMLFRLYPFVCGYISVLCIWVIVYKVTKEFSFSFYSTLIASVMCVDKTILLFVCCNYQICLTLFLLGLVAFLYDYNNSNIRYRFVAGLLWFLSLIIWRTPVIIIPYLLLVASILKSNVTSNNWNKLSTLKNIIRHILINYWIIILFILAFIVLFKTILAPSGEYAKYYSLNPLAVLLSPITVTTNCFLILSHYMGEVLSASSLVATFFIIGIIYPIIAKYKTDKQYFNTKIFCVVWGMYFAAILPHMFVHSPNPSLGISGWSSRFTSMLLFPLSLIISFLFQFVSSRLRCVLLSVFISGSILLSNMTSFSYIRGWARNQAIALCMKDNSYIEGKKIAYLIHTDQYSVFPGEIDRYYEIESCARMAFGIDTNTTFFPYSDTTLRENDNKIDYYMFVECSNHPIRSRELLLSQLFCPEKYQDLLRKMLIVKFVPRDTMFELNN